MGESNLITIIGLIIFGGIGALVRMVLNEGGLELPHIEKNKLCLGFIGGILIGATVGYLVDHSPLMAFFAGYTGFSALNHLMPTGLKTTTTKT